MLVASGSISQTELSQALEQQRNSGERLGVILRERGLITPGRLRLTLTRQLATRAMAFCLVLVIGMTSNGATATRATASSVEPAAGSVTAQPVSLERNAPMPQRTNFPSVFGSSETRSADISPFTKWTGILARLNSKSAPMPAALAGLSDASDAAKIEAVNTYYNKIRYVEDKNNYGKSDYWQTPAEFASRGGDCEDYVIAKYAALKALGFKEDQLRMVILTDTWKNLAHAILVVNTADGAKFLDNQYKVVKDVEGFTRYAPIYSINRTGWWRHVS